MDDDEIPLLALAENGTYAPLQVRYLAVGTPEHRRLSVLTQSDQALIEFFDMSGSSTVFGDRICSYGLDELAAGDGGFDLDLESLIQHSPRSTEGA